MSSRILAKFFKVGWQQDIVVMLYRLVWLIGFVASLNTLRQRGKQNSSGILSFRMSYEPKKGFTKLLNKTQAYGKVDLQEFKAYSETEFTLRDLRETEEHHFEYLHYPY
jgi:hypothetical protein